MPMNFLLLRGLKLYYSENSKASKIYKELRENLINNILKNYQKNGYLYETYNAKTGQG